MTGYDDRCPYCRERATLSVQYGGDVGPCPQHAVHWVGEPGQGPTSLHGNGAASFAFTSGDEDDVTCKLCLALLARGEHRGHGSTDQITTEHTDHDQKEQR